MRFSVFALVCFRKFVETGQIDRFKLDQILISGNIAAFKWRSLYNSNWKRPYHFEINKVYPRSFVNVEEALYKDVYSFGKGVDIKRGQVYCYKCALS